MMMFERALWAREERENSSANARIQPNENELIGHWVVEGNRALGDATCERINWLTETYPVPIAYSLRPDGHRQETLYRDPSDERLWERSFQQSEMHGDGPPRLMVLTPQQAGEKYTDVAVRNS